MTKPILKILDLFSGIGGFSLGLERTGNFETVAFCEIDKYCKLLLQKHWKGVKIYDDVKKITKEGFEADGIPSPDVITGGFPCQPFSVAGKQKGTSDDRHLWPEMFRIIKAFKPRFVIGENVRGIINIQDGVVFEAVCTDLESEGYEVQPFIIPAAGVGAPHRRERVWIIATNSSELGCRSGSDNWKRRQIQNDEERNVKKDQPKQQRWESRSREESNTRSITESRTNQRNEFRRQDLSGSKNVADTKSKNIHQQSRENYSTGKIVEGWKTKIWSELGRRSEIGRNEDVENSGRTLRQGTELEEKNEDEIREENANINQRSGSPSESDVANTQSKSSEFFSNRGSDDKIKEQSREETGQSNRSSRGQDVADTNTRLGNGQKKEIQTGRNTSNTSSEDMANTERERLERHNEHSSSISRQDSGTQFRNESSRGTTEDVANSERIGQQRSREPIGSSDTETNQTRQTSRFNDGSEREQGWWDVEPDVGRVAHGVSGRVHRLKGLGNAIVPQIAEEIGRAIINADNN